MKNVTAFTFGKQEFIIASTQPKDAFFTLGKFVAFPAEYVTNGQTNRPLTGLDVLTANTLAELATACERFAKHVEYMQAHPMPDYNATSPEAKADFEAWAKALALATA